MQVVSAQGMLSLGSIRIHMIDHSISLICISKLTRSISQADIKLTVQCSNCHCSNPNVIGILKYFYSNPNVIGILKYFYNIGGDTVWYMGVAGTFFGLSGYVGIPFSPKFGGVLSPQAPDIRAAYGFTSTNDIQSNRN